MPVSLDVGFKPVSNSYREFGDVVLASWTFKVAGPYHLIVWYKAKGKKVLTRGNKDKPYEARLVKYSTNGDSYTEVFTNGYLDESDVKRLLQELMIKLKYSDKSAMMPAA